LRPNRGNGLVACSGKACSGPTQIAPPDPKSPLATIHTRASRYGSSADRQALRTHQLPATCTAMTGSPLKRQRKLGVRAEDGSVIAFPRLTHPRAGLPHTKWRGLGPAEKIERLLDMSLDRAAEILSWGPVADLDAHRLHVWLQGLARRFHGRH
jgi:hypothetical protein